MYFKPITLAVMMAAFNQFSGINALLYYTKHIFEKAGHGSQSALLQSVIVGFVMLVTTIIAMVIIDHFGRKKLMIIGSIGYILSLACAVYAFFTGGVLFLLSLLVFVAAHGFGQGAVIWVFISEIFPNRVRARGQALGSFTHWFMAMVISMSFPPLLKLLGGYVFGIYAVCMVIQLLWVLTIMPETKGITLEQIQKELGIE
jgi:MFS family permease